MRRVPTIVRLAAAMPVLLVVAHGLGARDSTAVISGIVSGPLQPLVALIYFGAWFTSLLVTPVVIFAWGLLVLGRRLRTRP